MLGFGLTLLFFAALGILIRISSAKDTRLDWKPPFDTYETFDPKLGRLRRPYLTFERDPATGKSGAVLPLSVTAAFPWPALWKLSAKFRSLVIELEETEAPEGIALSLSGLKTGREPKSARKSKRRATDGQQSRRHRVEPDSPFLLRIAGETSQPCLITARIAVTTRRGDWPFGFLGRPLSAGARLRFFVGPELGTAWMGFDPGTTGSCLAAGIHGDQVVVEEEPNGQDRITPSLVVFGSFWEKNAPPPFSPGKIPSSSCMVGARAQADFGLPGTASFQSFKRFLGYHEPIRLRFSHSELVFEGKDLSHLLVRHVYDSFAKFLRERHPEIVHANGHRARCVVAIPNTFTITQAQAMRQVVADLGEFSEVRCLTEAEAVFFYHLSRLRDIPTERPRTVMVFDMGGSTMNATILRFLALDIGGQRRYKVEVLGRMGYGLGGDAIDYYLIRAFCRALRADLGDAFRPFDPFLKRDNTEALGALRQCWNRAAAEIKLRHGELMAQREPISANEALLDIINDAVFQGQIEDLQPGPEFLKLFEANAPWPEHPLHLQPELLHGVFVPLDELVRELVRNTDDTPLDAVIYSGRSCRFPSIVDRVRDALRKERQAPREIPLPTHDLKSAVARGCCWYGLNHAGILVSAPTTSASCGFRHTAELGRADFIDLIPAGTAFAPLRGPDEADCARGEHTFPQFSIFAFDNRQLVFYQIMGSSKTAFAEGQRHRVNPLLSVPIHDPVHSVRMTLNENDTSEHTVFFENQPEITRFGNLTELSMREQYDEHFHWFLGRNHYDLR